MTDRLDVHADSAAHRDGEEYEPVAILAVEAWWLMRWILTLGAVFICIASASGCGGPGWYRAAGDIPGVAATDYAFYNFFGATTQLYPFSPAQVESSVTEALGDLGFRIVEPPNHLPNGLTIISASAPDGRPTTITIAPQNSVTSVRIQIGPAHIGDEELSRDFLRRVAANFGTAMRTVTPIDLTLPKRWNATSRFALEPEHPAPVELTGEGLRPNENRDRAAMESQVPGQETTPAGGVPSLLQGLLPGGTQLNPYYPGVPYPVPPNPYLPFSMPSTDQ